MIAADTNLVIRHLTQDEPDQAEKVRQLFEGAETRREPVFLSHLVLCEVSWALKAVYGFEKAQLVVAFQALLDDGGFSVQERSCVEEAVGLYRRLSGEFSDHLLGLVAKQHGCSTTYTFDKVAARSANFTLLK